MDWEQNVTLLFTDDADSFQDAIEQLLDTMIQEREAIWTPQK